MSYPYEPYKWWVNNVLPIVYDDSLSYYEVLSKLKYYVDGLVNDVKRLTEIVNTIEGIEDVTEFTNFLKTIQAEIGNLADLQTTSKTDLVSAINEIALKANIAYYKPPTGIPESDLSQGVQDKLNKSGEAAEYIINNNTLKKAPNNNSPAELGLGTYSVPVGGIPWDTLSQDVQDRINASGGGTGGTTDYTDLNNKPQINGHTLNAGNNTTENLGLGSYSKPSTGIPESDLSAEVQEKLNTSGGIAGSETSFVATRDYEAGELIYINGVLYKTKYKILTGTNLVPGNNIEVTDISAEIERINSEIDVLQSGSGPDSWNLTAVVESTGPDQITNFFEYFNCIGGENYNFILDPVNPTVGYAINICKRDGTIVYTFENINYPQYVNRQRFTFTPVDTGEYYCTIRRSSGSASFEIAHARVTIEYTQSQGISELWDQVNAAQSVESRVSALEPLVEQHQASIEGLDEDVADLKGALSLKSDFAPMLFEHGSIDYITGEDKNYDASHRLRNQNILVYDYDIKFYKTDSSSAVFSVITYGDSVSSTNWISDEYTIPAGTRFRILILSALSKPTETDITTILSHFAYSFVQVNYAVKDAKDYNVLNPYNFENGSINSTDGTTNDYHSEKRVRSNSLKRADRPIHIVKTNPDINMNVMFYTSTGSYINSTDYISEIVIPAGYYYKILLVSTESLKPSDVSSVLMFDEKEPNIVDVAMVENGSINTNTGVNSDFNKASRLRTKEIAYSEEAFWVKPKADSVLTDVYVIYYKDADGSSFIGATWGSGYVKAQSYYRIVFLFDSRYTIYPRDLNVGVEFIFAQTVNDAISFVDGENGNDENNGSSVAPFKTIEKALSNSNHVLVKGGLYNEVLSISNKENISIELWVDNETFSTSKPDRKKITILNGTKLNDVSESSGILSFPYTAESGSNYYDVFVEQTVQPVTRGAYSELYNAVLVPVKDGSKTNLLRPVLSVADVREREGSFTYDDTEHKVYVHPYSGESNADYYVPEYSATGFELTECNNVCLSDIVILGNKTNGMSIHKCNNICIKSCEAGHIGQGGGFVVTSSNVLFENCYAYGIVLDGYGLSKYGDSALYNCSAYYCGDDGVSHHHGCTGLIDGGEWAYCGSGGITPSFGAKIDIRNVFAHDNEVGLQYFGADGYKRRKVTAINCVSVGNTIDVFADKLYDIVLANSVYATKSVTGDSVITEYGNNVLN